MFQVIYLSDQLPCAKKKKLGLREVLFGIGGPCFFVQQGLAELLGSSLIVIAIGAACVIRVGGTGSQLITSVLAILCLWETDATNIHLWSLRKTKATEKSLLDLRKCVLWDEAKTLLEKNTKIQFRGPLFYYRMGIKLLVAWAFLETRMGSSEASAWKVVGLSRQRDLQRTIAFFDVFWRPQMSTDDQWWTYLQRWLWSNKQCVTSMTFIFWYCSALHCISPQSWTPCF